MKCEDVAESDFLIRNTRIRVKHWFPNAYNKVIALHGWLDNAASFDVLAPLLTDCSVAAVDLAGQGFSDFRPASATYHLWDDILDIYLLAEALAWETFTIIGHSRGAMLACMFASAFPEKVSGVQLLDAVMPLPEPVEKSAAQLRRFTLEMAKDRKPRFFSSREKAIEFRCKASGLDSALTELFAARQLKEHEMGWFWCVDERLKCASAVKLTELHNQIFLKGVNCPVLIMLAQQGFGIHPYIHGLKSEFSAFDWHTFPSHHHLHMTSYASHIANLCLQQIKRS